MRKLMNAEFLHQSMKLQQMGAKVEVVHSKLCYVKFQINGIDVSYVYNINKKNQYFLERIKPYPLPFRTYESEQDIVDIIAIDIEQFKNVTCSTKIHDFIDFVNEMKLTINKFEDLILYYNLSSDDLKRIKDNLKDINTHIDHAKETSERVYFKKNPEYLK